MAVTGPNLETRAEYRFLRIIGADVVGMSTVPEVIVAVHAGMQVLGLSIVTDLCLPDALRPADIEDILATAAAAEPKLRKIVLGILAHEAGKRREDREPVAGNWRCRPPDDWRGRRNSPARAGGSATGYAGSAAQSQPGWLVKQVFRWPVSDLGQAGRLGMPRKRGNAHRPSHHACHNAQDDAGCPGQHHILMPLTPWHSSSRR